MENQRNIRWAWRKKHLKTLQKNMENPNDRTRKTKNAKKAH